MMCLNVAAGEVAAAKEKTLFLIVDYLPAAVYAGDEIALNVRVENVSKNAVQAELALDGKKRDGEVFAVTPRKVECPAGGFGSASFSVPSADATQFALKVSAAGETLSLNVDVLQDDEAWPKTVVRAGQLEKESGERIVWVPVRREKKLDRAFLPMKWLMGKPAEQNAVKEKSAQVSVFLPKACVNTTKVVELGPYKLDGMAPVLHAAREILEKRGSEKAVVIGLPADDFDVATEPRLFRIVLDGLLQRLVGGGIEQVAILPPFKYGVSDEQMRAFKKETVDVCAAFQARYLDPVEFLNEAFWRADPAKSGVYANRMNAAGRERMDTFLQWLGAGAK